MKNLILILTSLKAYVQEFEYEEKTITGIYQADGKSK